MKHVALLIVMSFVSIVAFAVASKGLAWDAVTTYEDGSALEADKAVVYNVYDSTGAFVLATLSLNVAATKLPKDACYVLTAALFSSVSNSMIPASESVPTANACTGAPVTPPPPPTQKRLGAPKNFRAQ